MADPWGWGGPGGPDPPPPLFADRIVEESLNFNDSMSQRRGVGWGWGSFISTFKINWQHFERQLYIVRFEKNPPNFLDVKNTGT